MGFGISPSGCSARLPSPLPFPNPARPFLAPGCHIWGCSAQKAWLGPILGVPKGGAASPCPPPLRDPYSRVFPGFSQDFSRVFQALLGSEARWLCRVLSPLCPQSWVLSPAGCGGAAGVWGMMGLKMMQALGFGGSPCPCGGPGVRVRRLPKYFWVFWRNTAAVSYLSTEISIK